MRAGAPLTEIDLLPMEELGLEIRQWILKRSLAADSSVSESGTANVQRSLGTLSIAASGADDKKQAELDSLYDF